VLAVPNSIHGSGTVSFDGAGTTISGVNDYTGSTLINSGILYLQSGTGLGATSSGTLVANGGQLYITVNADIGPEALTLNGVGDGNGAFRKGGAGATTYYGAINLASDSTIGVDGGATLTLSNSVTGAAALTVSGSGTLVLTTPNSYTGGTTLAGPVINLNANGALGTGLVTVNNTGRLVLADGLNFTNAVLASTVSPGATTGLLMVNDNTNGTVTTISGPLELDSTPATGGDFQGPLTSGLLKRHEQHHEHHGRSGHVPQWIRALLGRGQLRTIHAQPGHRVPGSEQWPEHRSHAGDCRIRQRDF
jgi:autotransporter-associated beta strand protein